MVVLDPNLDETAIEAIEYPYPVAGEPSAAGTV